MFKVNLYRLLLVPLTGFLFFTNASAEFQDGKIQAPTNFYIDIVNNDDVILLWEENSDPDIKEYSVLKAPGTSQSPVPLATVLANESSYIDTEVEPGKTYTYRVEAKSNSGQVAASEPKSIVIRTSTVTEPVVNETERQTAPKSSVEKLVDPESEYFWRNLLAINLLIIGLLLLLYLLIKYLLIERGSKQDTEYSRAQKLQKQGLTKVGQPEVKLKLKSDHEHPNVVEKAKDRVYNRKKTKIGEWVEAAPIATDEQPS